MANGKGYPVYQFCYHSKRLAGVLNFKILHREGQPSDILVLSYIIKTKNSIDMRILSSELSQLKRITTINVISNL